MYQHRGRDTGAAHQVKTTGAADEADDEAETPGEEREREGRGKHHSIGVLYIFKLPM